MILSNSNSNSNTIITVLLITILTITVSSESTASISEKIQMLGVVNGQVKDNQIVEVSRSLNNPELYMSALPDPLPQTLRINNAMVRQGNNGSVYLTVNQMLSGVSQPATVSANVTLWVDGKKVPATGRQQGVDVLVSISKDIVPQKKIVMRSDAPVTLQVPANWRGTVEVVMEISGEN